MGMKNRLLVLCLACIVIAIVTYGCSSDSSRSSTVVSSQSSHSYIQLPETTTEIDTQQQQALAAWQRAITQILAEPQPTFDNTVHALNDAFYTLNKTSYIHFAASNLSSDPAVRTAAETAYLHSSAEQRQVYFNAQLYQAIVEVEQSQPQLSNTDKRLIAHFLAAFEQNGCHLNVLDSAQFNALNEEIGLLEAQFHNNVTNAQLEVVLTAQQLQGLPDTILTLFNRSADGDYILDARLLSHVEPVLTYAQSETTRQQAYLAYYSVAREENPALLERLVRLRSQKAALLGYANYVDLKTATRMAKNATTAIDFLEQVHAGIEHKLADEKELLLNLKRTHTANALAELHAWDINFYMNCYSSAQFQLDHAAMRKYFSLPACLQGMFDTFAEVFKIDIIPQSAADLNLWHDDVQCFEIRDGSSGTALGLFYLDLYPREGKYTWFASDFTHAGNRYRNGASELPSGVLIGNWNKPSDEAPSLLSFDELRTLFHEFGHILHLILLDTTYAGLHDASLDFVEVPSQMLEQWCYDQRVLERFAVNYQNPDDVLPDDYVAKIKQADKAFSALTPASYIIARALSDLSLHSAFGVEDALDVDAVHKEIAENYYFKYPDESCAIARFDHLTGGYDAGYYSYLWSLAIVYDLKTVFDQSADGLLDSEAGARLKTYIYKPGLTNDETESVRLFLGRNWSVDAWLDALTR